MAVVIKEEKVNITDLSRKGASATRQYWDDDSSTVTGLYEAITAGSLQRIAYSLESIADSLKHINAKTKEQLGTYELQKRVTKLSMRLKKAGLDGDPNSDGRGRKK